MDIHDIWQEHKRWILGIAGGLLAFWIGWIVVGSVFDEGKYMREAGQHIQALSGELYDEAALATLKEESEKLTAAEQRLTKALAFKPRPEYLLEGKGPADLHFDTMNRAIRKSLRGACEERNVVLEESKLEWTSPTEHDDVQSTLIAFDVMERAVTRLLRAHEQVRKADPEAVGLVAIDKLRIDRQKSQAGFRGTGKFRLEDFLQEERVEFALRLDVHVLRLFLEACRVEDPPIAIADLKLVPGRVSGDPLVVTGKLVGILFKPQQEKQ